MSQIKTTQVKTTDIKTLNEWLSSGTAVLIDVREPEEFQAGRIEEAKNIPLGLIKLEDILLPEYKNKKIVMQCKSGVRSHLACQKMLEKNGDVVVYNLEGGIVAWLEAGLPVL